MTSATKTPSVTRPSPSLEGWQERATHTITVPSGATVRIRLRGVATLLELDALPSDVLAAAIAELENPSGAPGWVTEADTDDVKRERLIKYARLQRHLVAAALVDPALSYEEVTEQVLAGTLPEDDLVMICEITQRLRDTDALGVRLGVDPLERWATFRRFHECPEGCAACASVIESFSTVAVGAV